MRPGFLVKFLPLAIVLALPQVRAGDAESFSPKPLELTPDAPAEIPLAESGFGEPLPPSPVQVALEAEATLTLVPRSGQPADLPGVEDLLIAVFRDDPDRVRALLAAGVDPNASPAHPVRADLGEMFRGTLCHYFVTVERGLTPLMAAAALGRTEIARVLLEQGASPKARTKRHKTTALWLAGYAGHVEIVQMLLGIQPGTIDTRIEIDLAKQTAVLLKGGQAAEPVPISSGRKSFPTPKGEFVVTDKHRHWRSTLYPADMPFFMRLSSRDFGLHAGVLPGHPASHGCIRLRSKDAQEFFRQVPVGTPVVIR